MTCWNNNFYEIRQYIALDPACNLMIKTGAGQLLSRYLQRKISCFCGNDIFPQNVARYALTVDDQLVALHGHSVTAHRHDTFDEIDPICRRIKGDHVTALRCCPE